MVKVRVCKRLRMVVFILMCCLTYCASAQNNTRGSLLVLSDSELHRIADSLYVEYVSDTLGHFRAMEIPRDLDEYFYNLFDELERYIGDTEEPVRLRSINIFYCLPLSARCSVAYFLSDIVPIGYHHYLAEDIIRKEDVRRLRAWYERSKKYLTHEVVCRTIFETEALLFNFNDPQIQRIAADTNFLEVLSEPTDDFVREMRKLGINEYRFK